SEGDAVVVTVLNFEPRSVDRGWVGCKGACFTPRGCSAAPKLGQLAVRAFRPDISNGAETFTSSLAPFVQVEKSLSGRSARTTDSYRCGRDARTPDLSATMIRRWQRPNPRRPRSKPSSRSANGF